VSTYLAAAILHEFYSCILLLDIWPRRRKSRSQANPTLLFLSPWWEPAEADSTEEHEINALPVTAVARSAAPRGETNAHKRVDLDGLGEGGGAIPSPSPVADCPLATTPCDNRRQGERYGRDIGLEGEPERASGDKEPNRGLAPFFGIGRVFFGGRMGPFEWQMGLLCVRGGCGCLF
jgi:hypothetical protein